MPKPDILAGIAVGALVGCLLGVSTQTEIGSAVAAVLTFVTGLVGVSRPAFLASAATDGDQNSRMIAFGITATILFLGTYTLSVRHAFEPSTADRVEELHQAGYDKEVARALIASKDYATPVDGWLNLLSKKP